MKILQMHIEVACLKMNQKSSFTETRYPLLYGKSYE
jgi:hypothetical protein